MIAQSRRRRLLLILLVLSAFIGFLYINAGYVSSKTWRPKSDFTTIPSYRRVTKVSMLYGAKNSLYERALQSHRRHAERWGYGMDVLQEDIAVGYWNKPAYLLALVVAELARPDGERVEWLMWVDADSVIINPAIPLEIFLPPSNVENVHLVATKDHKGLNTGIFFLRVHQWTVNMLVEALAYPVYKPDIDLGMQVDQTAMERILNQTTYKANVTCLPRTWINTYEWTHAYEGTKGNLLVHFPGLGEQRWEHMEKWLDTVERTPEEWEVRVSETWYLQQTEEFWDRIHKANKIISSHEKRQVGEKGPSPIPSSSDRDLDRAVNELKKVLYEEPYEGELLDQRIKDCNVVLDRSN